MKERQNEALQEELKNRIVESSRVQMKLIRDEFEHGQELKLLKVEHCGDLSKMIVNHCSELGNLTIAHSRDIGQLEGRERVV